MRKRSDVNLLVSKPCNQPMGIEIFTDDTSWDTCVFDQCSEQELKTMLDAFISGDLSNLGFSVQIELSVALCLYGRLVAETAETLLIPKSTTCALSPNDHLLWSYFGSHIKYESICIELITNSREDFRDGIFIACYHLNTLRVYRVLVDLFMQWLNSPHWGNGSAELDALEVFLKKWDKTLGFTKHKVLWKRFLDRREIFDS